MADEEPQDQNTEEEAEGGSGKKKIIMIVAGVVVLLLIGGGAFLFLAGGEEEEETAETAGETTETAEGDTENTAPSEDGAESAEDSESGGTGGGIVKIAAPEKEKFGSTYKLKPFHLNLGNPLENRQIMIEISIQYRGDTEQKEDLESRDAQLRDAIISIVSRKTRDFLLGPDGKDQLRLEILTRLNQYLDQPIEQVYITDIMIE